MDDKSITALIERLLDGNEEITYQFKRKLLNALNPNYYPIIWSWEDMERIVTDIENDGHKVNRDSISYAMEQMIYNHDPEFGITWETLSEYAYEYCVVEDNE